MSELKGMAIVDVRDGKKLGSVADVVVSPDDLSLLGFVMRAGGGVFGGDEQIVEAADVRSLGRDAITVEGEEVAHTPDAAAEAFQAARNGERKLVGAKVVTKSGTLVGSVTDVMLDEDARRVAALTVGGGILQSGEGLPADRIVSVGPDVIVVEDEARS